MEASYAAERRGRARSANVGNGSNGTVHAPSSRAKRSSSSPQQFRTITWISLLLSSSALAFYAGVWTGLQAAKDDGAPTILSDAEVQRRVEVQVNQKLREQREELCKTLPSVTHDDPPPPLRNRSGSSLFSKSILHFAQGLVRVAKDDLHETFDFGVPPNPHTEDLDAIILYNTKDALPSDENIARAARYNDPSKPLQKLSAAAATENCETMNVILTNNPGNTRQCLALVGGQYPSYHVQRWMRRPDEKGKLNANMPLKLTSRGWTAAGKQEFPPPKQKHVETHQEKMLTYLTEVKGIKSRLKIVLEKMNSKTVVVLTCNHGQSELLMNFACSARARGFDLSNVLVFPTDIETKELAEGMGLTAFYEGKMMASIPKEEAAIYGDATFSSVMFAKVLCVQLVNELGYDLLFQDVDVVWFKPPLDYFEDKSLPEFDMYFQDDGSRQERYAPYSANTGFYFVRSNDRTRHLFRHFIYSADLITAWSSHQQVLIALLAEHNSLMGLTVKVFAKEMEEFPGGLQFHRKKEAMKKLVKGESNAIMFHMSWTNNKDDKVKFFQQMGEWYMQDECVGKEAHEINGGDDLAKHCCSAEPLITCHYRDKPSKIPCPDAPLITEKGKAFYKAFAVKQGDGFW
ncbi:hypothetical protein ACHAXT_007136 [Thalassiosira profunda]